MAEQFLYEQLNVLSQFGAISHDLPNCIKNNLKQNYEVRPYQIEAFSRIVYFLKTDFDHKQPRPFHLLLNMATGSGKTLIMAGAILYLYEQGYRNFLFFVNSNNIIQKTKDNFLNPNTTKYLFANKITFGDNEVYVREVETFDEADSVNINIKFTTIQQLHEDLNSGKENSVTYEDFQNKKIVLIADEAHHLNAGTKQGDLFGTFEDTVQKIHEQNYDNILLEFTATTDYTHKNIVDKYRNKVLFRYDLVEFRKDGYSKEINLLRSQFDEKHRVIQALILNLYRQELATQHNINLKPVILFKAKRTIDESKRNMANFIKLVENLTSKEIDEVRKATEIKVLQKAFAFFAQKNITDEEIVRRLQHHFRPDNCLSANDDKEAEKNQILLNTLEDENNPIRAIFAVQKLNEGWDVLNLFDIVRMYEERNEDKNGKVGKTTIAEAQLIGRGARYFPFVLNEGQNKYTRKFDSDNDNELKVLEELYYHTKEDSRYISELKKALVESGIYEDDDEKVVCQLKLKNDFMKTAFYQKGIVVFNSKIPKSYNNVKSFNDLSITKRNYHYHLSSSFGKVTRAIDGEELVMEMQNKNDVEQPKDVKIIDIPQNVLWYALSTNPFFYFNSLTKYFPNITSKNEFIFGKDYLGGCSITFEGCEDRLKNIKNEDYLIAVQGLLKSIESEIKAGATEYEGSGFTSDFISNVFKNKELHINKNDERAKGQEELLKDKDWYAYNANFGTTEEKKFVELFARRFETLNQKFDEIYLLRNEKTLKIIDKIGRTFEPDFLLFCKAKTGKQLTYQVFIEPKGKHLIANDKWKEDFLKQIRENKEVLKIGTDHYLITGVPFYNYNNENEFAKELESVLE